MVDGSNSIRFHEIWPTISWLLHVQAWTIWQYKCNLYILDFEKHQDTVKNSTYI